MDEALGANVAELTRALKSKGVPLPHEVGTFIALEVANALVVRPCAVTAATVFVNGQGQVAVAELPKAPEIEALSSVLMLLGELLVASAPGVPESLLSLVEEAPAPARVRTVKGLRDELEAALVPLNRSATMRILGRIAKDAFGSRRLRTAEPDARSEGDITSAIDAMLGVDSAAADALRVEGEEEAQRTAVASRAPTLPIAGSPQLDDDVSRMDERSAGGLRFLLLVVLFVIIAGGVAYFVRQGALGAAEPSPETESHAAAAAEPESESAPPPQAVTVHVDSVPRGAQILLEVPESAREVRVAPDVAHEFVAVYGDGHAQRVVVAPGREPFEADLQRREGAAVARAELGPSLLHRFATETPLDPERVVQLKAPQGTHIYKLVGLTPSDLQIHPQLGTANLILYRSGFSEGSLTATAEELDAARGAAVDGGAPSLSLSARLSPLS